MNGKIYLITNKLNGKQYVGQTYQNFNKRMEQHIKQNILDIDIDISKYGIKNFNFEIILAGITNVKQLNKSEVRLIKEYKTYSKNGKTGYNKTKGGGNIPGRFESPNKKRKRPLKDMPLFEDKIKGMKLSTHNKGKIRKFYADFLMRPCWKCMTLKTIYHFNDDLNGKSTHCNSCVHLINEAKVVEQKFSNKEIFNMAHSNIINKWNTTI